MRGVFSDQGRLFSYISPEARVPANHPLRKIRKLVRDVLGELNRSLSRLYASEGRADLTWPTETRLHGWGGRTRSAPGDRQGVGGASPLR